MPPDEYQESINNSIYTNTLASLSVHFARYSSCLAGRDAVEDVPDSWLDTVQRLVFPFNTARRYHEEYEGYEEDVQNSKHSIYDMHFVCFLRVIWIFLTTSLLIPPESLAHADLSTQSTQITPILTHVRIFGCFGVRLPQRAPNSIRFSPNFPGGTPSRTQ